jgi:multidrug resistance efflux pump
MRQLRNRQSLVTSHEEGTPPPARGMRVTQILYYAVLVGLVAFVIYYAQDRMRFWAATGVVASAVTPVAPSIDGRILEIYVEPGQSILPDDELVLVKPGEECAPLDRSRLVGLELDARLAEVRHEVTGERIRERRMRLEGLDRLVGLELGPDLLRERDRLVAEIEDLEAEQRVLALEMGLREQFVRGVENSMVNTDTRCAPELVRAPADGVVHEILREEFGVVARGEAVLTYKAERPDIRVVASVDPELVRHLFVGKEVTLEFPDGQRSAGRVANAQVGRDVVDALDFGSYRIMDTDFVVEIVPAEPGLEASWLEYDRLYVDIRGRKGRSR